MRYPLLEQMAQGRPLETLAVTIDLPRPTTKRGLFRAEVRFDRVTEDMVEAFCRGECAILALALHELSGFSLVCQLEKATGEWRHAAVAPSERHVLDLRGETTWEESLSKYNPTCCFRYSTSEEVARVAGLEATRVRDLTIATPLFIEAVYFLAEQIVNRADWGRAEVIAA